MLQDMPTQKPSAEGWIETCALQRAPRVFGLDCEMVVTEHGPELAQVTLVEDHSRLQEDRSKRVEVVLELMVRPRGQVLDYLTELTGLTAETLGAGCASLSEALDLCAMVLATFWSV
eukprot:1577471-Amphidinium_carterae.1